MNESSDRHVWEFRTALNVVADLAEHTADLPDLAQLLVEVRQAKRELGDVERILERTIGERMPGKNLTVEGVGVLERGRKKLRREWDRDALLSAVLDSRLVDHQSGEVADESPLDKVLHVWHLPAPRTTALRDRAIDADEFCQTEDQGWTVRIF